ncbi:hypothetical protein ACP70R_012823 [Stipagrostis hirtigluma subsp. patula]
MDVDKLAVRFHFGGQFLFDGNRLHYVGGEEGMSYIERDLISLPEVIGHLKDHGVDGEDGAADVFVESVQMQIEALADDERRKDEGQTVVDVEDDSSDGVEFLWEQKASPKMDFPIKIEEPSLPLLISTANKESRKVGEIQEVDSSSSDSDYRPA